MQNRFALILAFMLAITGFLFPARQAVAAVNCDTLPPFARVNYVEINQRHIFCGEIGRYGASGFHSRPNGEPPNTIIFDNYTSALVLSHWNQNLNQWDQNGIYELNNFLIDDGVQRSNKGRSTMFPDYCTQQNVLDAIAYAAQHNDLSGPSCLTVQGQEFEITVHWLRDQNGWYINSAYPRL